MGRGCTARCAGHGTRITHCVMVRCRKHLPSVTTWVGLFQPTHILHSAIRNISSNLKVEHRVLVCLI